MVHIFIMQAETGSEMLLNNAEIYGQYFAQALMNDNVNVSREINESKSIVRNNIGNFATDTLIAYSTMLFITVIQAQFVMLKLFYFPITLISNNRQCLEKHRASSHSNFL